MTRSPPCPSLSHWVALPPLAAKREARGKGKSVLDCFAALGWGRFCREEPGRLQSMGSLGVAIRLSDFTLLFHFHALEKEMATHSTVLAWRISETVEPGGLSSMGSHRVGHD